MTFHRLIGKSVISFFRDDGLLLAASLSYFTMMALVPFCLFLVALFGQLLGNYPDFYSFLYGRLSSLFPSATERIAGDIVNLISHKGLGKVSLLLYGLLSFQLFLTVEKALNVIFRIKKKRPFLHSVVASVIVITLVIVLIGLSFAAASVIPLIKELKPYFPGVRLGRVTTFTVGYVLPFIMVLVTMTVVYRILPRAAVSTAHAFRGASFTTVMLEIGKHVFTWYVVSVSQFGRVYGSLTAFVLFLLWLYYSSSLFLIGAGIVYNLGGTRKARGEV
ncbi:MAG: YihY/virulence factor BrkB family protein [Thermodesulfovibrionales bacterium]